jgi:hypothetical protein
MMDLVDAEHNRQQNAASDHKNFETIVSTVSTTVGKQQSQLECGLLDDDDDDDDRELPFAINASQPIVTETSDFCDDCNSNFIPNITLGANSNSTGAHYGNDAIGSSLLQMTKDTNPHSPSRRQLSSSIPGLASSDGSSSRTEDGESQESISRGFNRTIDRNWNMTSIGSSRVTTNNNNSANSSRLYDSSYLDAAASLLASGTSSKLLFSSGVTASPHENRFPNLKGKTINSRKLPPAQSSFVDHNSITQDQEQQQPLDLLSEETSSCLASVRMQNQLQGKCAFLESHEISCTLSRDDDSNNSRYPDNDINTTNIVSHSHNSMEEMRLSIVHEDRSSVILTDCVSVREFINDGDTLTRSTRDQNLLDSIEYSNYTPLPFPESSQSSQTTYATNPNVSTCADGSTTILSAATPLVADVVSRSLFIQQYQHSPHRLIDPSLNHASLAGAFANQTGSMSFQVSIIVNVPLVQYVMDIVANPELLRLWCNPIMSGAPFVITRCSEGARTVWNWREGVTDPCLTNNVIPSSSEQSSNTIDYSDEHHQAQHQLRQYDGEWIEATTIGPVIEPHSNAMINIAGSVHKTCQLMSSLFGCPQYGKVSMFVERQKGQVSFTIGPFAGNIEVHHRVLVVAVTENNASGSMHGAGKVRIIDDVRLLRSNNNDNDSSIEVNGSTCCSWNILQKCYNPNLDDHMHQTISSMAHLRFLIENGATCEEQRAAQNNEVNSSTTFSRNISCRSETLLFIGERNSREDILSAPLLQHA